MPKVYQTCKMSAVATQALKEKLTEASQFREGLVVTTTLIKKASHAAFFEIGQFGTGIVFGAELQNSRDILKGLEEGNQVSARIEEIDGHLGYVELSLSAAGRQKAWQEVQKLEESGKTVSVKVMGANQGGLLVDLYGLKAFVPISQLSNEHTPTESTGDRKKIIDELQKLAGEQLEVKVIAVISRSNKLILSERETSGPKENLVELLSEYEIGQTVQGTVSGIADFGIFVRFADNPEIEGLVHISEIDHKIIDSPKDIVKIDEKIEVKIIEIKEGRVFLSLKALKADPWESVKGEFKEGQEVSGKIYKFNPFGAVIELDGGVQGLIHVSEYGGIDEMKQAISQGETYPFVIAQIKLEEKRLILKPKGAEVKIKNKKEEKKEAPAEESEK